MHVAIEQGQQEPARTEKSRTMTISLVFLPIENINSSDAGATYIGGRTS